MRNSLFKCVFFFVFSISIYGRESETILLEWEDVPYASEYKITIKNQKNKIIFEEKTTKTKIKIKLLPGEYKKKLTVYNKLGEIETQGKWLPLNVFREKGVKINIKWQKIPFAKEYVLEIKTENSGKNSH